MTTATVPSLELHKHPAIRKIGIAALLALLLALGAKGVYELIDVVDGPGTAAVSQVVSLDMSVQYGSADAAERWLADDLGTLFGSADAAEHWTAPVAPEMGSADATEHWTGR